MITKAEKLKDSKCTPIKLQNGMRVIKNRRYGFELFIIRGASIRFELPRQSTEGFCEKLPNR